MKYDPYKLILFFRKVRWNLLPGFVKDNSINKVIIDLYRYLNSYTPCKDSHLPITITTSIFNHIIVEDRRPDISEYGQKYKVMINGYPISFPTLTQVIHYLEGI